MAYDQYDDERVVTTVPKKADIILRIEQEIAAKQDELSTRSQASSARIEEALEQIAKTREEILHIARQNGEIYDSIRNDYTSFKREFKYIAIQNESVFKIFSDKLGQLEEEIARIKTDVEPVVTETGELDYDALADKVAARIPAQEVAVASAVPVEAAEIDYDVLVDKLVARMPVQETYVAAPQSVPVTADLQIDYDALADKVASRIPAQEAAVTSAIPVEAVEIDYDALADKVASRIPSSNTVVAAAPVTADLALDYDELADKVISRIPVQEAVSADYIASKVAEQLVIPTVGTAQIDYDTLAEKLSDVQPTATVAGEIDYEALADKVAERIPTQQAVVAGEPASVTVSAEIDYDLLADKVAERLPEQHYTETVTGVDVDYDLLAEKVAALIPAVQSGAAVIAAPANVEIDEEDLADRIALKVGAIKAEDFDIIVDDDGCNSISKELAEKLDYDYIAAAVAEKLRPAIVDEEDDAEIDYDEMAARISEKITVAGVNEDAIADKAAAALSNYLPEIDADEIADKVASQVISALPEINVDTDYISSAVSEKLIENQADHDYDIVLDEDNLERVAERISQNIKVAGVDEDAIAQKAAAVLSEYVYNTDEIADKVVERMPVQTAEPVEVQTEIDYDALADKVAERVVESFPSENGNEVNYNEVITEVTERVSQNSDERFDDIAKEISEIKEMLTSGDYVVREVVREEAAPVEAYEEPYVAEESLVTVSEVVAEQEAAEEEAVEEETVEEIVEEAQPVEEVVEEPQPVEEVVEEPETEEEVTEEAEEEGETEEETLEEFTYDDLTSGVDVENMSYEELEALELKGGVDFANMMRYNRSFIARIIQSSDDQKGYYGSVRNALLSYKKVNSNIAWGAERFHKGRETIARFKIRGKTLILYLALDPAEHEYSVYHHKDVSDNKSVAGTPMMIKVKSPRGVKKAIRLIDEMLLARGGEKRNVPERDYAAMYPYETIKELIEDGLVKDVRKDK
ncbi:MAG: hypothetical protein HDP34_06100 [Clostridia bacterium]|nr:hypothetical protein [Clostridia bacterium]